MPTIALVTTDPEVINDEDVDIGLIIEVLGTAGVDAEATYWHDPQVQWTDYDLVIMRSPWDYPDRLKEFQSWLDRVESTCRVLNPPTMIRWNLDKNYLFELAALGVTIVPTVLVSESSHIERSLLSFGNGDVVVKPTISVGSRDTGLFGAGDRGARVLADKILRDGKEVLVQAAVPSVSVQGEHALVYFNGRFSHGLRKGPILSFGGGHVGGTYTEDISAAPVGEDELLLAGSAIRAIAQSMALLNVDAEDAVPLYARFDIVETESGFALLEAELFEPSYFLSTSPGADQRFVEAVVARLRIVGAEGER